MKAVFTEGSASELAEFSYKIGFSKLVEPSPEPPELAGGNEEEGSDESLTEEELAERFLTRRYFAPSQRAVVEVLIAAEGEWVLGSEIAAQTNYSRSQFSGMMGAFGRRLNNTQGAGELKLIDMEVTPDGKQKRYRARPSLIAAWKRFTTK